MTTKKTIRMCGAITKTESLIPITANIIENTFVAEANLPYSDYYGKLPEKIKANSLFLFTTLYYPLEEVLHLAENIKSCYVQNINIASAMITFDNKQYPAIRVKNFTDYEHIYLLQNCFSLLGVEFPQKINFLNRGKTQINKCFELIKLDEGIYLDQVEKNKGYLFVKNKLELNNFELLVAKIKNNSNCRYFDAVTGITIKDSKVNEFIRIYSEGLNLEMLNCLKNEFQKFNIEMI